MYFLSYIFTVTISHTIITDECTLTTFIPLNYKCVDPTCFGPHRDILSEYD